MIHTGLIGIVPALGMLRPAESGVDPVVLSVGSLIAWTFSVAFFGVPSTHLVAVDIFVHSPQACLYYYPPSQVFFAVPLRRQTVMNTAEQW